MREMDDGSGHEETGCRLNRRQYLGSTVLALGGAVGLSGCAGLASGGEDPFDDYGPQAATVDSNAVGWDELGDLEGTLTLYSGRSQDQIAPLFRQLEDEYPGFEIADDYDGNSDQLNSLREEGENTPADVFYTQSSGALASLKEDGLARKLPDDVVDAVDDGASDPDGMWTGASGRVRAIQYNTDSWASGAEELPEDIFEYATDPRFEGIIATRPNSGTFRSFITAMIEMEGESATREWVRAMVEDQDIELYASGSQQAEAVANGQQTVALGNQYYAGRILSNDPDSPIDVAFTRNDPGCLFNVSGIAILEHADNPNLAAEFTRHVLAARGQEFFVEVNGEYPVVDGVEYVGDLPTVEDINPPEFDLNALGNLEPAVDLLREEGMRV